MSADAKRSFGSTIALVVFGLLALYGGTLLLLVLIPAAALVWYADPRAILRRIRD